MDPQSTNNDIPWELIVSALQGDLSPEEDLRFREWLASSRSNQEKYDQLLRLWKDGMADYAVYREADEGKAWEDLQGKMGEKGRTEDQDRLGEERKNGNGVIPIKRWMAAAAAAVLLLVSGAGWWYMSGRSRAIQYETANEQKKISLPDGSTVVLQPQTHIQLARNYNTSARTVILISGKAHFDVSHQAKRPFMVDMDAASVKDIGTSFIVEKTMDSIKVTVSEGKIAFIKKDHGESREIAAGGAICLYTGAYRSGEIRATYPSGSNTDSLRFDNAPLSEVIAALQKISGKNIRLSDTLIGHKRLTVHLAGESFDDALKIICASLNLAYTGGNGEYILKNRDTTTHN
ncbi:FecR domain-containing protein [Flavitalea sp. BT771]|uniref:FecR family protein n=1 Tax=Flavitalea sp. BT771 TaxID=3063329 RepID=UPI0026E2552C|nr:FecR domain-containing protein [Flavitalea sp. BT771]MDO6429863.1 FecR domain-containing protein [Flavitalea sp. BT771]MDV6218009.1 FecR domain-containing protein [Flavitalea sp. BT771]